MVSYIMLSVLYLERDLLQEFDPQYEAYKL